MKYFLILAVLISVVTANNDENIWEEFKHGYGKTYSSFKEEQFRFQIFQKHLRKIEEHNKKYESGQVSYYLRLNQFADLLDEEFEKMFLNYDKSNNDSLEIVPPEDQDVPDEIDWREKGAVLGVRDQRNCGAGWAFSAVGALEAQNVIKHNITLPLSEQQFIDCVWLNKGCDGGDMVTAFNLLVDEDLYTKDSYPYNGSKNTCNNGSISGLKIRSVMMIIPQEINLKNVVGTRGPVSIGINGNDIKLYGGGLFNNPNCSQELNHDALAVGYGTKNNSEYWIVKNSWGENWGENGYLYIARNKGKQCGVGSSSTIPIIF